MHCILAIVSHTHTRARDRIVTLGLRSRAILGILPSNNTSLSERSSSTADTHTHLHSTSLRVVYYYYIIFLLLLLIHILIGLIMCVCARRTFERRPELFLKKKKKIHAFYIITHIIHIIYHIRNNNIMLWHGGGCRSGREQKKKNRLVRT